MRSSKFIGCLFSAAMLSAVVTTAVVGSSLQRLRDDLQQLQDVVLHQQAKLTAAESWITELSRQESPQPANRASVTLNETGNVITAIAYRVDPENIGKSNKPLQSTRTVVVDVMHVFQNWKQAKQARDRVGAATKSLKRDYDKTQVVVKKKQDEAKKLPQASKQRQKLDREIKNLIAKLEADQARGRTSIKAMDLRVLTRSHRVMKAEIEKFARRHNIDLVLNFNRTTLDENTKPQTLWRLITQHVTYHFKRDITLHILDALNRRGGLPF